MALGWALQALYKASKARFDEDDGFKARAREAVTRLQSGDAEFEEVRPQRLACAATSMRRLLTAAQRCTQAWKRICEASRAEFDAIYARLDVRILWRGESFYNPRLAPVVSRLMEQGVAVESEGAQVVWVAGSKQPLMVRKSDGGFGYGTTDMAALEQRIHVRLPLCPGFSGQASRHFNNTSPLGAPKIYRRRRRTG